MTQTARLSFDMEPSSARGSRVDVPPNILSPDSYYIGKAVQLNLKNVLLGIDGKYITCMNLHHPKKNNACKLHEGIP